MKSPRLNPRLIALTILLLAFAVSATPARATKLRVHGDESARANSKTRTQHLESGVTPWKGSVEPDATRRAVEVTDIGPERGFVFGLDGFLINQDNSREILASTGLTGVFRSTDGGRNWHPANIGLTDFGRQADVPNIRRDPNHPRTVYALGEGLYRSTDFGEHWNQLTDFFGLKDIAVSSTDPSVLFAVADGGLFYKSTDGGVTLVPQTGIGLPETDSNLGIFPIFTNVVITPSDPQTMYVVDNRHGVYKSTDGGASFNRLSASPFSSGQVFPHPTQRDTIFVEAFTGTTGLFRSLDGGATFTEITAGLPAGTVQFITFDPKDPSILYASSTQGLLRSTDRGSSFKSLGITPEQLDAAQGGAITLSIDPANAKVLYVNTGRGNFKSVDRGQSFMEIDNGFRATQIFDVAFDNDEDPSLYVIANGLLFRTRDRGRHYEEISLPPDAFPLAVAVAPSNRNRILVITSDTGILRSIDGGRSWSASLIDTGSTEFFNSRIVFDPQNARNIYVASPALLRSTDGGRTFTTMPVFSLDSALAIDPQHPNVLYLSGIPPGQLLRSADGGLTFAEVFTTVGSVNGIVINPQDRGIVYIAGILNAEPPPVATFNLVLRSTDGGVTFTPADAGLSGRFLSIGIDPLEPTRLFAMFSGGLFETEDGGASWTLLDAGGETFLREPDKLAINPKSPRLIYLGGASLLEVEIKR